MPKHSSSLLELARRGAQQRYAELQAEVAALVRQFPDLRGGAREVVRRGRRAVMAATEELRPRKRRRFTAATRARMAAAQRARWAKRKAASGGESEAGGRKAGKKR